MRLVLENRHRFAKQGNITTMQIGARFRCYPTHAQAQSPLRGIAARRVHGSAGWVKAACRVDMWRAVVCQISHVPATDRCCTLYVFEALKIPARTTRRGPRKGEGGRWVKTGTAAKSGLDKAVMVSIRGQTKTCLRYKAGCRGKLVIASPAPYCSHECAACGHIHPDNRVSRCGFVRQRCNHTVHADHDGAQVLGWRGVRATLAGRWALQESKWCRITRVQVGAEGSEPRAAGRPSTRGEITVRRRGGNISARGSWTLETPPGP